MLRLAELGTIFRKISLEERQSVTRLFFSERELQDDPVQPFEKAKVFHQEIAC